MKYFWGEKKNQWTLLAFYTGHHTAFHNYLPTQHPRISILIYTDPVQVQVNITSISKSIQEMH